MSDIHDALTRAKHHSEQLGKHIREALDAHVYADSDALGKHLRAAKRSQELLSDAHKALADATNDVDPLANPTGHMGAQVSDGQQPRGFLAQISRNQYASRAEADRAIVERLVRPGVRR